MKKAVPASAQECDPFASWIDGYLRHLSKERRLSPNTSSNYARDLAALAAFLRQGQVGDWKRVDSQHVRMFAARSHAGGRRSPRRLAAMNLASTYCV